MYEYKCRIIKVVDGDTVDVDIDLGFGVWLNNKRVRLYGIDTPECRTRDEEEKYFGFMAKALVKDFLPEGSTQRLSTLLSKSRKGKFGRILGEFWIYDSWTDSQTTINKALLIRNYAVKYDGQSKKEIEKNWIMNDFQPFHPHVTLWILFMSAMYLHSFVISEKKHKTFF